MSEPSIKITAELPADQAWALAEFFKRAGFSDYRNKAQTDDEAYLMRDAAESLRQAFADASIEPR